MGQSTDAILCWGIDLGDALPWEDKAEELGFDYANDDECLAFLLCGVERPPVKWEDEGGEEAMRAYGTARRKALADDGVEIVEHCSGDYPMYILAITASVTTAHRGYSKTIISLEVPQEWNDKLQDACLKLGVDDQQRRWILCSMWS